ncbi:MAG TPA: PAS domain-containing protein, partial [Candidatus Nanoarchaeia archaeon]|nr:PAS domain-containing protein [Candidatus Nanoarchaeia archaeon]
MDEQELRWVRLLLLLFFYYSVASGLIGLLHPEWFFYPSVKTAQAMFEISMYSIFYYFSHNLQSDVYFLYFLPLFLAVHFLGFLSALWIILFATLNLYFVFLFIGSSSTTTFYLLEPTTLTIFVFRVLILISMSLAYAVRRRASLIQELKWNRSQFGDVLRSMDEGIFIVDSSQRLLFVSPLLRDRHGTLSSQQSCSEYFQSEAKSWKWNNQTGELKEIDTVAFETYFTDKDGGKYKVAVNLIPLQGNNDRFDTAVAIVKDLSQQRQLLAELDNKVQEYAKRINVLNSKRTLIQQTY